MYELLIVLVIAVIIINYRVNKLTDRVELIDRLNDEKVIAITNEIERVTKQLRQ